MLNSPAGTETVRGLKNMSAYASIKEVFQHTKTKMQKTKSKNDQQHIILRSKQGLIALSLVFAFSFSVVSFSFVSADRLQEQIDALSAENNKKQQSKSILGVEASSLNDAIAKLQAQINAKQAAINEYQSEVEHLKTEIAKAEKELARQRSILGETIKAMYLEGDISTLEMLATSKNLSDFFDKQQYRESVQNKIKTTVDKITQLKLDLNTKKDKTEKLIAEQKQLRNELLGQRGEKDRLLSLNENQRSSLDRTIRGNNAKIAELQRQQIIENARFIGAPGRGVACGGGYPGSTPGPAGNWGCNHPKDNTIDNWGMYNRECVSYTAFKVAASGRHMPYWGGRGNANRWDDNARAAGIPVDGNPRSGDVAISNSGFYGHAMYVESVNSNGTINISQYNAGWDGTYSTNTISAAGLVFIHFR
jgi:surface antigen/peptidoglycan hydrolase CwlO-like protein